VLINLLRSIYLQELFVFIQFSRANGILGDLWKGYKLYLDTIDGDILISAILTSASVHDSQMKFQLRDPTFALGHRITGHKPFDQKEFVEW